MRNEAGFTSPAALPSHTSKASVFILHLKGTCAHHSRKPCRMQSQPRRNLFGNLFGALPSHTSKASVFILHLKGTAFYFHSGPACFHFTFLHLRIILMGQDLVFSRFVLGERWGWGYIVRGAWLAASRFAGDCARLHPSPPFKVLPRLDAKPGYSLFISSGDFLANTARGVSKYLCRG